jgi:hypothetical protein
VCAFSIGSAGQRLDQQPDQPPPNQPADLSVAKVGLPGPVACPKSAL